MRSSTARISQGMRSSAMRCSAPSTGATSSTAWCSGPSSTTCMQIELVASTPRLCRAVIVRVANERPSWCRIASYETGSSARPSRAKTACSDLTALSGQTRRAAWMNWPSSWPPNNRWYSSCWLRPTNAAISDCPSVPPDGPDPSSRHSSRSVHRSGMPVSVSRVLLPREPSSQARRRSRWRRSPTPRRRRWGGSCPRRCRRWTARRTSRSASSSPPSASD